MREKEKRRSLLFDSILTHLKSRMHPRTDQSRKQREKERNYPHEHWTPDQLYIPIRY